MEGIIKQERIKVKCTGCREEVEAVAQNGIVAGYCAKSRKMVRIDTNIKKEE
jgi:hypothetical protein